jgi:hypothetical protein
MVPGTVSAQSTGWEIEVHGGGALASALGGGTGGVPAAGAPFTSVTDFPTRRVSSWLFGDGANLLNDTLAAFDSSQEVTALDTGPFEDAAVSSTNTILDNDGTQIVATGTLNINLLTRGRFIPYASVGAGVISNNGDTPTANLEGDYTFEIFDLFPISETDRVSLRHAIDDTVLVGVFGGGIKVLLTDRSGIRVDVRVHLGDSTNRTLLDADPDVVEVEPGDSSFIIASFTDPSVQFSNDPTLIRFSDDPTGVAESTLTGSDINDFEAFTVSGVARQFLVSVGYFWRF